MFMGFKGSKLSQIDKGRSYNLAQLKPLKNVKVKIINLKCKSTKLDFKYLTLKSKRLILIYTVAFKRNYAKWKVKSY
jgi:hypothetical protein